MRAPASARGSAVAEALVAAALAGVAIAGLAAGARLATEGQRLARDTSTALALASERLEALRAGPRTDGTDATLASDGTSFARSWRTDGGRGRPVRLDVRVAWRGHALALATEAIP
jgi:hypothetical protein